MEKQQSFDWDPVQCCSGCGCAICPALVSISKYFLVMSSFGSNWVKKRRSVPFVCHFLSLLTAPPHF